MRCDGGGTWVSRHHRGSQRARGIWGRRGRRGGRAMGGRWWVDARRELVQLQTRPLPQSRAPRSQRALLCAPIVRLPPALRPPLRPHPSVGVLHASGTQRGPSRSTSSSTSPTRSTEAQLTTASPLEVYPHNSCPTSCPAAQASSAEVCSRPGRWAIAEHPRILSQSRIDLLGVWKHLRPVTAALYRRTTSRARDSCALVKLRPSRRAAANSGVIWGRSVNSIPPVEAHVVRHGGTKS
ncbi:hypothetical protein FA95DRAFT_969451 [Auriscalpium vulgare]|uniref:Uncharacterized protein n=1 Tax=Auriscalpium vulgare TaxID=40419 RepID=A0ACB8R6V3_9AGAM|nr:hypothetical protein FA95DRAFT_969451 [Auriscalpium vulgare]